MSLISRYTCVSPCLPCTQRALGMKRAAAADEHLRLQMTLAQSWSLSGIRGRFNSILIRLLGFGVRERAPTRQSRTHRASLKAKGTKHMDLHQSKIGQILPQRARCTLLMSIKHPDELRVSVLPARKVLGRAGLLRRQPRQAADISGLVLLRAAN